MIEAVTTLMWSAPRLQTDVQELRVVSLCTNIVLSVSYVGLCLSVFDKCFINLTCSILTPCIFFFKQIADQLGLKYGKKFAHEASINANSTVNDRVSNLFFSFSSTA